MHTLDNMFVYDLWDEICVQVLRMHYENDKYDENSAKILETFHEDGYIQKCLLH